MTERLSLSLSKVRGRCFYKGSENYDFRLCRLSRPSQHNSAYSTWTICDNWVGPCSVLIYPNRQRARFGSRAPPQLLCAVLTPCLGSLLSHSSPFHVSASLHHPPILPIPPGPGARSICSTSPVLPKQLPPLDPITLYLSLGAPITSCPIVLRASMYSEPPTSKRTKVQASRAGRPQCLQWSDMR